MENSHKRRNRKLIRLQGFDYSQPGLYFVTIVVKERQTLLGEIVGEEMEPNNLGRMVANTWEWLGDQYPHVELDEYVVMPNHIHGIIVIRNSGNGAIASHRRGASRSAPTKPQVQDNKRKPLGRLVGAFKTVSTKNVNLHLGTTGRTLWQRNYYEHVIRSEESLMKIRQYIRDNPAKWAFDRENPSPVST